MRYQVDFLPPLKLKKYKTILGYAAKYSANQFAGFFNFDLFDLFILIPGVM